MTVYAGIAVLTVGLAAGTALPHQEAPEPPAARAPEAGPLQEPPTNVVPLLRPDPFGRLFVPAEELKPEAFTFGQQPGPQSPSQAKPANAVERLPRVVCGMVVVPSDPKVDPAIVIPIPENTDRFSMKRITPPVCQ